MQVCAGGKERDGLVNERRVQAAMGKVGKEEKKLQPTGMKELASGLNISEAHEAWCCPRRI